MCASTPRDPALPALDALRAHVYTALATPGPLAAFRPQPARRAIAGGVVFVAAGGRGPDFNYAVYAVALQSATAAEIFRRADAFFGPYEPYSVVVDVEAATGVDEELRRRGWTMDEEEPALALPALPDPLPAPPAGLAIHRVCTEATLADFRAVNGAGSRWLPSLEAATAEGVAVFVGYATGADAGAVASAAGDGGTAVAVATARVARHGDVGDVTGVVTRPEYRRRGFGTAMTWAAVAAARDMGCAAFVLTATELGYPVYRKMGFMPVCTLRTYLPPAPM
jgi:GNAT superfamily N-acetyltransferase